MNDATPIDVGGQGYANGSLYYRLPEGELLGIKGGKIRFSGYVLEPWPQGHELYLQGSVNLANRSDFHSRRVCLGETVQLWRDGVATEWTPPGVRLYARE